MSLFFINLELESDERFDMGKFYNYETDAYDVLTSDFFRRLKQLKKFGEYNVQNEEGRPDRLSKKIYNSFQYWWILLAYNDITETNKLESGMTINFPSLDDLEDLLFSLKGKQIASEAE